MIRLFIPDPDLDFFPIPDPTVKKALDPGSRSAILFYLVSESLKVYERYFFQKSYAAF
jgi:hypothetical protein